MFGSCFEHNNHEGFKCVILLHCNMFKTVSQKTGNWVAAERAIMNELCSDSSH